MLVKHMTRRYIGSMTDHHFQLVGGTPVLDFLNTIDDWTAVEPRDYLPTFADTLRFAQAAGVLETTEARRLAAMPEGRELTRLRELRTRLERVFRAIVTDKSPSMQDLEQLSEDAANAARGARLRAERGSITRVIEPRAAGAATVRWRLVEAAIELLTSDQVGRLSACPSCGWFFLDTTKNQSRRWCSMEMCGSAAKARAYYWRTKGRLSREPRKSR